MIFLFSVNKLLILRADRLSVSKTCINADSNKALGGKLIVVVMSVGFLIVDL